MYQIIEAPMQQAFQFNLQMVNIQQNLKRRGFFPINIKRNIQIIIIIIEIGTYTF